MKKILLLLAPVLAFLWAFSPALSFKVSGKITDEQGNGLNGVIVKVKGSSIGTISASDGTYKLETPDEKRVLSFSCVGYIYQ
ncbi:MAG: carboxypeptidase-like regulatory domain-containing protein, partial [Bacteroidota bacterium]